MEKKYMVAVDLGTEMIGLAVAEEESEGRINTLYFDRFPSSGIECGKVQNAGKLSEALKIAVENAEAAVGGKIRQVRVNAQKQDIRELDIVAAMETDGDGCINDEHVARLKDMARRDGAGQCEANEKIVAVIEQSYDTDDERNVRCNDIVGRVSGRVEGRYKVYVCRTNSINAIERAFKNIGIEDVDIDFCPDCCGRVALTQAELEGGCALIDFGAGACSLSIFRGGSLRHYWAVPFGGKDVTNDIKSVFGISGDLAGNIKMGYGGCLPDNLKSLGEKRLRINIDGGKKEYTAKYLSEIITARCTEILDALLYEIQRSGYSARLKSGLVLCGGGAGLLNLDLLIHRMSGYNCRIAGVSAALFSPGGSMATASEVTLAGLLLSSSLEKVNACVEISSASSSDGQVTESGRETDDRKNGKGGGVLNFLFGGSDDDEEEKRRREAERERLEEVEKRRKEEEKLRKEADKQRRAAEKLRREEEKRRREEEKEKSGSSIIGTLFGNDGEDA